MNRSLCRFSFVVTTQTTSCFLTIYERKWYWWLAMTLDLFVQLQISYTGQCVCTLKNVALEKTINRTVELCSVQRYTYPNVCIGMYIVGSVMYICHRYFVDDTRWKNQHTQTVEAKLNMIDLTKVIVTRRTWMSNLLVKTLRRAVLEIRLRLMH